MTDIDGFYVPEKDLVAFQVIMCEELAALFLEASEAYPDALLSYRDLYNIMLDTIRNVSGLPVVDGNGE